MRKENTKEFTTAVGKPLVILIQNTLKKSKIPEVGKYTNVPALFKKGTQNKLNKAAKVLATCLSNGQKSLLSLILF